MKIFLIRHGEANPNIEGTPLTKHGIAQAKTTAKNLLKYNFEKVYSSNLIRAKDTAKPYLKLNKSYELLIDERLNEICGVLVGGPKKEETPKERKRKDKKRADEAFKELLKNNGSIAVFCHGNIIKYYLNKVLESKDNLWENLAINNGSISILEFKNGELGIEAVNNDSLNSLLIKERIRAFEKIRDIPYHIPESPNELDHRCWGKNRLLLEEFKKLGYEARLIVTKFSWDIQHLPKELTSQAPTNSDIHPLVEIKINGEWIKVDATVDSDFSKYPKWDGETDTKISIHYDKICTPEESIVLNNGEDFLKRDKEWYVFGKKLNDFFAEMKKK